MYKDVDFLRFILTVYITTRNHTILIRDEDICTKYRFGISCPSFAYHFLKVCDYMQKGKVLSFRRFGISDFLRKNYILILLTLGFVLGILFGTFWFFEIDFLSEYPKNFIADYFESRTNKSFFGILLASTFDFWSLLFLAFMMGTGIFGVVTVPLFVMILGFFQGGITAYLYSEFALKGIAFNAVVYIPSTIIFIIVFLTASREAICFSLKLSSLTLDRTMPFSLSNEFKNYGIKFLIFGVAVFFSALVDTLLSSSVLKYFNL